MAGLSNIFGGDNSNSSADGSAATDTFADAGNTIGLDVDSQQDQESTDEDGNSQSSSNSNTVGLDSGTDSLLSSVSDATGSSDQTTSD